LPRIDRSLGSMRSLVRSVGNLAHVLIDRPRECVIASSAELGNTIGHPITPRPPDRASA
jgi:hypothetical protein